MEYRKDSNLKVVYILIIGISYFALNYLLPVGKGMDIMVYSVFLLINLSLYISGAMKFYKPKYTGSEILGTLAINLIFFFSWFLYSWDLWLFPFLVMFSVIQIVVRYIMLKVTFRTGYLTILGSGKTKKNVEDALGFLEGYKYIPYNSSEENNILEFMKKNGISLLILGDIKFSEEQVKILFDARISGVEVKNYYDFLQEVEGKIDVDSIGEEWILNAYGFKLLYNSFQIEFKRAFDIILAIIIGIMTLPIMIAYYS